jgi:hypothetical protein
MNSQYNPPNTPVIRNPSATIAPSKPATNAADAVSTPRVPFNHPVNRDLQPSGQVRDLSTGKPLVR